MLIPMEILSQMTTRADSGSGVRQKPQRDFGNDSQFNRALEQAITEVEQRIQKAIMNQNTDHDAKDAIPVDKKRDETKENTDEVLAAGVMGTHNEVVFILEGDKESATTPEIRVDSAEPPDIDEPEVIITPEKAVIEPKPETLNTDTKKFSLDTDDVKTEVTEAIKVEISVTEKDTQTAGAVNTETATAKPADVKVESSIENNLDNTTGEVAARMPIMRTQDRQENTEENSKSSENGNLSPLENENDAPKVKGQKEKTYSDTADAVKNAAENKSQPISNEVTPPLSEGIRPEQFRADQQMKQIVPNAPVKAENLFEEMISRVEMMQNDTKSAMTIQLKPEFLGNVALEVAVDSAGLHVKISAEDVGVRSMINGQLNALIESLENKGIEVVEVEVAYTGVNYGTFKDPREGQQQPNQQRRAHREINSTDGVAYYSVIPELLDYYLDAGVSSVEYRA